ncbi:porin [Vibrio methylphosphonaticus]|uniref:porin n=1 Tax=Vibrio methylphosphonaticus TaxID=2946866 RepID=UPI00202A94D9|nr:porin [Vibrio methylphosphonaticus]MCL9773834.1 porin [Vibrio methylphosphonaticus]
MNKKFIALAVAAAAFGTSAQAVELYNKDGSTFAVGGHVSVGVMDAESEAAGVNSVSPRINFEATQDLGNGFTADAKGEWALNMLNGGDNSFTTRLGYIGVSHEEMGRVAVGTQWAPYYNAGGVADLPIAFANDFLYDNHGALGTGRADAMLAYSNAFDFANAGAFNFGLGWQGATDVQNTYNNADTAKYNFGQRAQVALGYDVAGFGVNYAYTGGDITSATESVDDKATSHLVSAKYGTYGKGIYVAGVYAMNQYMNSYEGYQVDDTKAYEAILAYGLSNSLNLSINYESVKYDGDQGGQGYNGETIYSTTAIQAEYDVTSRMRAYAGYEFDLEGTGKFKEDNTRDNVWMAGVRFFL